jgi:hypothetical protein
MPPHSCSMLSPKRLDPMRFIGWMPNFDLPVRAIVTSPSTHNGSPVAVQTGNAARAQDDSGAEMIAAIPANEAPRLSFDRQQGGVSYLPRVKNTIELSFLPDNGHFLKRFSRQARGILHSQGLCTA